MVQPSVLSTATVGTFCKHWTLHCLFITLTTITVLAVHHFAGGNTLIEDHIGFLATIHDDGLGFVVYTNGSANTAHDINGLIHLGIDFAVVDLIFDHPLGLHQLASRRLGRSDSSV